VRFPIRPWLSGTVLGRLRCLAPRLSPSYGDLQSSRPFSRSTWINVKRPVDVGSVPPATTHSDARVVGHEPPFTEAQKAVTCLQAPSVPGRLTLAG
jgi:hypothetical protein